MKKSVVIGILLIVSFTRELLDVIKKETPIMSEKTAICF